VFSVDVCCRFCYVFLRVGVTKGNGNGFVVMCVAVTVMVCY
jgi:hypothetical protein